MRDQIARAEAGTRLEAAVKRASRSLRLRNSLLTVAAIVAFVLLTTGLLLSKNSDTSTLGGKFLLSSVAVIVVAAVAYGMANYLQYGKIAVNQEAVGNAVESFYAGELGKEEAHPDEQFQATVTRQRLIRETERLSWRATTNSIFGTITTLAGVGVLWYVVFIVPDVDPTDHWRYMVHFVLRFSIAIFIETFAYFFLRLYRNSLDDIKYYQNEITNIEARWGAMRVARDANDKALMKIALEGLSKTERNAVLKKGKTTIGLERDRLDKNEIMELFRAALGIGRRNKQDD